MVSPAPGGFTARGGVRQKGAISGDPLRTSSPSVTPISPQVGIGFSGWLPPTLSAIVCGTIQL